MSGKQKSNRISSTKSDPKWWESENWTSIVILFAYGFIPVITPNWQSFDSNGPKFLTFSLVNLFVLIYFLISEYKKNGSVGFWVFLKTKIGFFYFLLIVVSFLSFFKSINVSESVVHFGKIFTVFTATWIIAYILRNDKSLVSFLAIGMVGLLIYESIYVFVEIYKYIIGDLTNIDQIKSGYSNKNILSASLFIKIPFAIYLLYFKSGWVKKIGITGVVFGVLSILILSTRAFYLGALVLSFFYIVFLIIRYYKSKESIELKKITPYLVSVIFALIIFSYMQRFLYPDNEIIYNYGFTERLSTISNNDLNIYRLNSWEWTLKLIKENPLLGVGLGNWKLAILEYENPSKPDFTYHLKNHNDFLEITAEVGIVGLLCFLALFLLTFLNLVYCLFGNRTSDHLGFLFLSSFGLLAYSFDAFFNFPQDRPEVQSLFAIYLGLSVAISRTASFKTLLNPTGTLANNFASPSRVSKLLLLGMLILSAFSTSILYLNFKSLRIQRILKDEQVTGKSLVNSDFLIDNFPPIPNLSSTSDPINGLIGKKLNDEKKYEEALEILKESNPNPYDARREFYISIAYFNLKQLDSAENYIKMSYNIKPMHFLFTKFYANILELKGQKDKAVTILDHYLSKYKMEPEAWKYSAILNNYTGNKERVMQLIDSASYYFPNNEEIGKLKEFYTYKYYIPDYENALKFYNEKKYFEAIKFFQLSYSDYQKYGNPNRLFEFLNSWAFSLLETNKVQEAKEIFTQVSERYPTNYFALKNLGFISFQFEKNYSSAIEYYLKSLKADNPDLFQSYMNLGTIYLIQGSKDLAISNYEKALSHGKSELVFKNLYLLWKEKGNSQKADYYFSMLNKN